MSAEVITALCAGIVTIVAAVGAKVVNTKLNSIHILVNSRLTEALNEIEELQKQVGILTSKK